MPAVDFNRDVIPILSNNCFHCHGPDPDNRKAGLRLDIRDVAIKQAESGATAIVPGKPDDSELVRRIFSDDPDERMPSKESNKSLTDSQKQVLRRWIAAGAEYKPHWSFVVPQRPPTPHVKQANWAKNPIDNFVLEKLEAEGLHPSPEADRYTLVRRLHLDLIGLPPTPEEADAFVHDTSPDAYERLVDKLLSSPRYGERWARRWLDLARYADTNGYEKDRPRSIWPYRDWVINALNADMPFDEFTVEQLAGDMLPAATAEQKTATGFHRNTMRNEEGGIDPLEFRYYSLVDRVSTTGTTWLGLTVGCAVPHAQVRSGHQSRVLPVDGFSRQRRRAGNAAARCRLRRETIGDRKSHREVDRRIAESFSGRREPFVGRSPSDRQSGVRVQGRERGRRLVAIHGPAHRSRYLHAHVRRAAGCRCDPAGSAEGRQANRSGSHPARQLRAERNSAAAAPIGAAIASSGAAGASTPVKFARAEADFSQKDWPVESAIDGDVATGWGIATADGSPIKEHKAVFSLEQPPSSPQGSRWTIKLEQQYGGAHTIARLRLSVGTPLGQHKHGAAGDRRHEAFDRSFANWAKQASQQATHWHVLRPAEMHGSTPTLNLLADNSVLASGDLTKSDTYDLTFHSDVRGATAVLLEVLPHESLPKHGPGMIYYEGPAGDFFLSEIQCVASGRPQKFASATQSFSAAGFEASHAIDGDPQTGWMITGTQGKPNYGVFRFAQPADATGDFKIHMLFERYYAAALGRFRISISNDPHAGQSAPLPPEIDAALATPAEHRTAEQLAVLRAYYASIAPELAKLREEIERLRGQIPEPQSTLVMSERPAEHARQTRVHHRGEFLQAKEPVEPGVPAFLPPLPPGTPRNRLTLARWLVSPDNPLTARVTVNRQWAAIFGRGIVRTLGDFGYQGEPPSNPALLDWLAVELVRQKWSLKKITRLIVTSATYRQSSRISAESLARDPQNILLARESRFRLDAEVLRDAALKSAGLLSEKLGGPSVFPPQPASVTTEGAYGSLAWNTSTGEDRYRRSLYTYAKRTAPFAMFNTFDAPSGEACVARRDVSNSPLQALTLLNDTVLMEAAQSLGKLAAAAGGTDESCATLLFRRCLIRPPETAELTELVAFAAKQRQRFAANEAEAAKLAGDAGQAVERATWTAVARALLNLDETITRN